MRPFVYWDTMESPIGRIFVVVNASGALTRLTYGVSRLQFFEEIGGGEAWDQVAAAPILDQLAEYFSGERKAFDIPIDLSGLTPFQRDVLHATQAIPYGEVCSYGDVAAAIGKPGAARAVGRALGQNPIGVVIPCHRVVASDGSLHGYSGAGGVETKRFLLELEGYRRR